MKIQCDVCGAAAASVLCCADEAALCSGCDGRIHSANKLAGKHRRTSFLHHAPSKIFPLCDICKEKRAFVFCQEDRAILCLDCDWPIHSVNGHAGKHSRFLLTGVRLSFPPPPVAEIVSGSITGNNSAAEEDSVSSSRSTSSAAAKGGGGITISDYLMTMLPEWRVDDFLSDNAAIAGKWIGGCDPSRETAAVAESAGSSSGALLRTGGAAAEVEDAPIWAPPLPAHQATPMSEGPPLDYPEIRRSGKREEISTVPLIQYPNKSIKRSMEFRWC